MECFSPQFKIPEESSFSKKNLTRKIDDLAEKRESLSSLFKNSLKNIFGAI